LGKTQSTDKKKQNLKFFRECFIKPGFKKGTSPTVSLKSTFVPSKLHDLFHLAIFSFLKLEEKTYWRGSELISSSYGLRMNSL